MIRVEVKAVPGHGLECGGCGVYEAVVLVHGAWSSIGVCRDCLAQLRDELKTAWKQYESIRLAERERKEA